MSKRTSNAPAHERPTGLHRDERPKAAMSRQHANNMRAAYLRFGAMIAMAMTAMFVLTYVNTYALDHVRWSETRFYMTFVMGAAMAVIMLGFMRGMYTNRRVNIAIVAGSAVVFAFAIWLVRSQATIEDRSYMRAMIPHHSIAILTSERSNIDDLRVRELADEIITSQRREIAEMEWLIQDIGENGVARTADDAGGRLVPDFGPETPQRRFKRAP
jgi:uncharacterized protein (DUF305 family)